ncbi:MAG: carbamate kinase, partial [bacterium]
NGVAAVIDKDLTSALMSNVLGVPVMMLLTAVSQVAINFGKPDEQLLEQVTVSEIKQLLADGHFPPGSMGPKINAAIRFIEGGGERVIIAHLNEAIPALNGDAGTHIVADTLCR